MIMRTTILAMTALALPLALTACGEGSNFDEGFKSTFREKLVTACVDNAKGSVPQGVNVDLDKICGCSADKIMEGKSASDLVSEGVGTAEQLEKVKACFIEHGPSGMKLGN